MKVRRDLHLLSTAVLALAVAALYFANPAAAAVYTWDSSGTGTTFDGPGTWSTSSANWWNAGDIDWSNASNSAVFGVGTGQINPYTVTLGSNITAAGITFANQNYTIAPDAGGLYGLTIGSGGITANAPATIGAPVVFGAAQTWTVASGQTLSVSGAVSGGYGLTAAGSGLLTLFGSDTYSGATLVSGGTLAIAAGAAVTKGISCNEVAGGLMTISGTLSVPANGMFAIGSSASAGTVTMNSGVLTIGPSACAFVGGKVAGNGTAGLGTFNINGGTVNVGVAGSSSNPNGYGDATMFWVNPYASGGASTINLNGGMLSTARPIADGGSGASVINFNGGTLQAAVAISIIGNPTVGRENIRNGGAIIDTQGYSVTLAHPLLHSNVPGDNAIDGGLTKVGSGTLTLSASNTYTGTTTLAGGAVNLDVAEHAGTSGPLGESAANNPGSILLSGGYLQYTSVNSNDYSGRFSTAANQQYNVDVNGQHVSWSAALTSSAGSLNLKDSAGGGQLTLTNNGGSTYSGSTIITSGTLAAGAASAFSPNSAVTLNGGALNVGGYGTQTVNALTLNSGALDINLGSGTLASSGLFTINGGALDLLGTATASSYTLMTFSGTGGAGPSALTAAVPAGYTLKWITGATDALDLVALQTTAWNLSGGGSWNSAASWSPAAVPSGDGASVLLGSALQTSGTVTLDGQQTVGILTINNSAAGYTLTAGSGGVLVFSNSSASQPSQLLVNAGSHAIAAPVEIFNGNLTVSQSTGTRLTISGNISDDGLGRSLTLAGGGMLLLSGSNTYGGSTVVSGGTLQLGDGAVNNGSVAGGIVDNSTLVFANPQNQTYSGAISGSGALAMTGPAVVLLSGNNTYTGATTVSAGLLQVSGADTFSGATSITGGTLAIAAGGSLSNAGNISATGGGLLSIAGSVTMANGATNVASGGTISVGATGSLSNAGNISTTGGGLLSIVGTVTMANSTAFGIGAGLNGTTGTTTVSSGAVLNLGGGNSYVAIGGDFVNAAGTAKNGQYGIGTLNIDGGLVNVAPAGTGNGPGGTDTSRLWFNPYGFSGTGGSAIDLNGGTLSTARPIGNGSGGTASINFNGGTLEAAANNINIIDNTGALIAVNVLAGGATINTNGFNTTVLESLLHGAGGSPDGGLTKVGAGTLTLSSSNTYTGPTTISAGSLALGAGGSIASSPTIALGNGATFNVTALGAGYQLLGTQTLTGTGSFSVAGSMTVAGGATVGPFNVGTLSVGALTLNSGSILNYDFGNGSNDLINVSASGGLKVQGGGMYLYQSNGSTQFSTTGDYTLMDYTGSLGGSVSNLSVLNPIPGDLYAFSSNGSSVQLTISAPPNTWTGGSGGPAFNWSNSANWSKLEAPTSGNPIQFSGTVGLSNTNDISGLNVAGLFFSSSAGAFNLSGNSIQLSGPVTNNSTATQTIGLNLGLAGGNQAFNTTAGNIVVNGVISDGDGSPRGIVVGGNGVLTLTASNTYSGGTVLGAGTLQVGNNSSLGSGLLTLNGGEISSSGMGGFSLANPLAIGGNVTLGDPINNGTLSFSGSGTLNAAAQLTVNSPVTLGGSIGGSYGLTMLGPSLLVLGGSNSYSGPTTVSGGTLAIAAGGSLINASNLNTTGGGVLSISGTVTMANNTAFGVGAGLNGTTGTTTVNSGAVLTVGGGNGYVAIGGDFVNAAGTGHNNQFGIGTLNIDGGLVNVGPPGTSTNGPGGTDSSHLWFSPYGSSGTGGSTINLNGGTLSTARPIANGSTGAAFINFNDGTLQAAANNINIIDNTGSVITVNVLAGGATVDTNGFNATILQSLVNGTGGSPDGGLTKIGAGTLILSAANSYNGATNINAGTLMFSGNGTTSTASNVYVNNGATLTFSRNDTWGPATTTASAPITVASGGTLSSGGYFNSLWNPALDSGTVLLNGGVNSQYPAFQFAGTLTATGTSSINVGSGNFNILNISGAGNATLTVDVVSAADILTVNAPLQNGTNSANSAQASSLAKAGLGMLLLTAANSYSGGTQIIAGTLQLGNSAALGTGGLVANGGTLDLNGYSASASSFSGAAGVVANSAGGGVATLTVNQSTATTFSGAITDPGAPAGQVALVKMNIGTLTLNGTNTYSGGTTLGNGSIIVTNPASLGAQSGALSLNSATLEIASGFSESRNITLTNNNAAIQVDPGQTYTNTGMISGTGSLDLTGAGTFVLAGAANLTAVPGTQSAGVNVNAGFFQINGPLTASVMNVNGAAQLAGTGTIVTTGDNLYYNSSTPSTFGGSIVSSSTNGGVEVVSGALTLTGSNTFFGQTNIDAASSLLTAGAAGALSPNSPVNISGGTLDASGFPQTIQSLMMTGGALNLGVGNLLTSTGTAGFAGTLNVLGFSGGTAELMSYSSDTGTFGAVTGLSGAYQLSYGLTQLDIVASPGGPATWQYATSGSWNDTSKWSNGLVPSGSGAQAVVGAATTASWTITLDGPQTLGTLTFTDTASSTAGYTLAAGSAGSLTMNNSGSDAQIIVAGGTHGISAPVEVAGGNLDVSASDGSTLTISGSITDDTGARLLTLGGDGTGTLILSGTNTFGANGGGTVVSAGTLILDNSEALAGGSSLTVGDASAFGTVVPAGLSAAAPTITAVPEPSTLALFAAGVGLLALFRKRTAKCRRNYTPRG